MAASASERLEKIRDLLARHAANTLAEDHHMKEFERYEDLQLSHLDEAITLLQGFVDQAAEPAAQEDLVEREHARMIADVHTYGQAEGLTPDGLVAAALRFGLRAGIRVGEQMALETWEPDERLPEARTVVDPAVTSWSFTVEGGLSIVWQEDAGEREFVLEGETTRAELIAALAMVTEAITPFPILTHDIATNGAAE